MPLITRQSRQSRVRALSAHGVWQHFRFVLLLIIAGWLIVLGQFKPQLLTPIRVHVVDSLAPILDSLSRPAELMQTAELAWQEWFALRDEVKRLRIENARLKAWEHTGTSLQAENHELKALLNFRSEPVASNLTARVIAATGAPFAASLIVTAGSRDGVKKNMTAVSDDGLVGRVIEVGEWSARILLLTDPESRIPVSTADQATQAIIAGDGSRNLNLRYLPLDTKITAGTRLLSSGHGGLLPPQLPVAVAEMDATGKLIWQPIADTNRLHYVRLVEYTLAGGEANIFNQQLAPAKP
jgi:rod shape-determining protein MreC